MSKHLNLNQSIYIIYAVEKQTNRSGCCSTDISNSTASALAIIETPGRDTVHCWSSVRSLVDCMCAELLVVSMCEKEKERERERERERALSY